MSRVMVIGIDASGESSAVWKQASGLVELLGLRAVLAHVMGDAPVVARGNDMLERAELLVRTSIAAEGVERRILVGEAAEALEKLAVELDAALIAVGSRGRGPMRSAIMGSVSRALVTRGTRPVLVVPPAAARRDEPTARRYQPIVCGVDGSEHSDRAVVAAADVARRARSELLLVHGHPLPASPVVVPAAGGGAPLRDHARLNEREKEAGAGLLERAARLAAGGELTVRGRLEPAEPAGLLERVAEEEGAALISVGARGQGAVRAALVGSTSARLARRGSRPVMVLPPGARLELEPFAQHEVA